MSEERDIPTLDDLAKEIEATAQRLDQQAAAATASGVAFTADQLLGEIRNTILPLMADIVASAQLDIIEIRDVIDPVKLTTPEAEEIEALLQAFKASRPTDTALGERVDAALEILESDGGEDGEEDEEEEPAN